MAAFDVRLRLEHLFDELEVIEERLGEIASEAVRIAGAEHLPRRVVVIERLVSDDGAVAEAARQCVGEPLRAAAARGNDEEGMMRLSHTCRRWKATPPEPRSWPPRRRWLRRWKRESMPRPRRALRRR